MIAYTLPWPPSMNAYWRRRGHHIHLSAEAVSYLEHVRECVGMDPPGFSERLRVSIELERADRKRYDIDNFAKVILDSLQKSGVFRDDGQVDELRIRRLPPGDGVAYVVVEEINAEDRGD